MRKGKGKKGRKGEVGMGAGGRGVKKFEANRERNALWSRTTKNHDVSTALFVLVTHTLAPHFVLRLCTPLRLFTRSLTLMSVGK